MEQQSISQVLLTILTSVVTGGFVLVLIEIGNRRNRESDRYEQIMVPFMRNLSSYLRFVGWCKGLIKYPENINEYESNFKVLIDKLEKYGGRSIMSGDDYGIDYFSSKALEELENDINNVWYYYDKMHPCRISISDSVIYKKLIDKELDGMKSNHFDNSLSVELIAQISGEHYCEMYRPIASVPIKHELFMKHYSLQSKIVIVFAMIVLSMLAYMLFGIPTIAFMRFIGVMSILMMGISVLILCLDTKTPGQVYNKHRKKNQ